MTDATPPNPQPLRLDYLSPQVQREQSRRLRRLLAVALALLIVGVAVAIGAGLNALDDRTAGGRGRLKFAAMIVCGIAAITVLSIGSIYLGRARAVVGIAAVIMVLLAVVAAMLAFEASGIRRRFEIHAADTIAKLAHDRFLMRLYLCWAPTVIVGAAVMLLSRRWREILALAGALAVGAASAVLWAADMYGGAWSHPMKWAKLTSTGLLVLTLLLLCTALAGAIEAARRRQSVEPAQLHA